MAGYTTTKCHRIIKTTRNKYLRLRLISHFFFTTVSSFATFVRRNYGPLTNSTRASTWVQPWSYNYQMDVIRRRQVVAIYIYHVWKCHRDIGFKSTTFYVSSLTDIFLCTFFSFSYSTQTNYYNSTFIVMEYPENVGLVKSSWNMFER